MKIVRTLLMFFQHARIIILLLFSIMFSNRYDISRFYAFRDFLLRDVILPYAETKIDNSFLRSFNTRRPIYFFSQRTFENPTNNAKI